VCGIAHVTADGRGADQTCATCLGATRDALGAVVELSARLLDEATHKGVRSEAANLHGAAADTTDAFEAWRNRQMSALMDRIPPLPDDDGLHPLWVLGGWETLVREHYDQPSEDRISVQTARDYLAGHLTRLAHDEDFPFDELAGEVRRCRGHLEDVLHDQPRGDYAAVGCFECGADLERRLTKAGFEDVWTCRRCRRTYTHAAYMLAIRARLEEGRQDEAAHGG
jgi:ribosomal protein L37AE/L43A